MPLCDVFAGLGQHIVPVSELFSAALRGERNTAKVLLAGQAVFVSDTHHDGRPLDAPGVYVASESLVEDW